jgi:hypothetical protein
MAFELTKPPYRAGLRQHLYSFKKTRGAFYEKVVMVIEMLSGCKANSADLCALCSQLEERRTEWLGC